MKFTSATFVTLTGLIATVAQAFLASADPQLAYVGGILTAVYTICHAFLNRPAVQVSAPKPVDIPTPSK